MEINDYSTRLAQTKNRYNEATQELKDNYNDQVESLQKNHDTKTKNQQENYVNQKLEMEDRAESRLNRYDKDLKSALNERTERYMDNLKGEREQFSKDRKSQMNGYNQKLRSISKSFDTAVTEKDKLHAMYKDNMVDRYETGLTSREKDFQQKVAKLQDNSVEKMNAFRDQQTNEKKDLISDFNNEKKSLVQDANITRNKINSKHQLDMERLRENSKQKENTQRNNFENANANLRKTKNMENEEQRRTFEKLTSRIQDKNTTELQKQNRVNKEEKRDLEKSFAQNRIQLERRSNKLINEGSSSKVESSRRKLKDQHENQLANLQKNNDQNNYNNALLNERLATTQAEELKKNEIYHLAELDKKDDQMRELREEQIGGLKENFEDYQETMSKRTKNLELKNETQSVNAKKKLTSSLAQQRAELGRQINFINTTNQRAIANIKDETAEEQSKFIEKTKRNVHNEIEGIKSDMRTSFTRKEQALMDQIEKQDKEKLALTEKYETKIDDIQKRNMKETEKLKLFEHERRAEDRRAAERQLEAQQRDFEQNMMSIRREYDKRLDKAKANNDLQVTKLTERYESQISRERNEHAKQMATEVSLMKSNYEALHDKTEMEKNNLVNQYELKLNKLREANRVASEVANTRPEEA